jgi:hypothetical protein
MKLTISALMLVSLSFAHSAYAVHGCTTQTGVHQCACEHRQTSSDEKPQTSDINPKPSAEKRASWAERSLDRR